MRTRQTSLCSCLCMSGLPRRLGSSLFPILPRHPLYCYFCRSRSTCTTQFQTRHSFACNGLFNELNLFCFRMLRNRLARLSYAARRTPHAVLTFNGDGVGSEIVAAARRVLDSTGELTV